MNKLDTCKDYLKRLYNSDNNYDMSKEDFKELVKKFGYKMLEQARVELNLPVFAKRFCKDD